MADTRRRFLRTSGTALLSTVALAGCTGDSGTGTGPGGTTTGPTTRSASSSPSSSPGATPTPASTRTDTGTRTPTATGGNGTTPNADYTRWLARPSAFDREGYAFASAAPAALLGYESALGEGAVSSFRGDTGVRGIDSWTDVTAVAIVANRVTVLEATFDRTTVESGFADAGFETTGTRSGFTVFEQDVRAAAVSDDAVLVARRASSADQTPKRPLVEAVIDASAGDSERYPATSDDCGRLVDALGSGHFLVGRTHAAGETFANAVGEGTAMRVGTGETDVRAAVVFSEGNADTDAVNEWASDADVFFGQPAETTADGRTVVASATVDTRSVTSLPDEFPGPAIDTGGSAGPPQVAFAFEYEATGDGTGRLQVTHQGGDSVAASQLFVRGSGFADVSGVDQTGPGPWQGTKSEGGMVRAGDRVDVGVTSAYEIRVVWEPGSGDRAATLALDEGPDA